MRTVTRFVALAILALAPVLLSAQRGGMGGMGGMGGGGRRGGGRRGDDPRGRPEEAKFPAANELQRLNPAGLLVDNRKKLSLSDSQVTALTTLRGQIWGRNADLLARYDSVRKDYRPASMSRERDTSVAADSARRVAMRSDRYMRALLDSLRDRRTSDVKDALDLVPDQKQHKTAVDLLSKQDQDFLDQFPKESRGFGRPPPS